MSWHGVRIAVAVTAALATLVFAGEVAVVQPAVQTAGPWAPTDLEQVLRFRLIAATVASGLAIAGWSLWAGGMRRRCAERTARARIEVVGMVAHDLRSPLTGIALAATRLERARGDEDRQMLRTLIERECARLSVVADDILSICCDGARQGRRPATECLPGLLEDVAARVRDTNSVDVTVEWDSDLSDAMADPSVARTIANVAENAARHACVLPVRISAARRGRDIEVTIEDDGSGFAPDFAIGAFTTGALRGRAGLGLASSRRALQRLGGSLRIGSSAVGGAAVSLRFPEGSNR